MNSQFSILNSQFNKFVCLLAACVVAACSTTKNLPEGEVLYTGQKPMIVQDYTETSVGETAMEEVEAALAAKPNNSFLGSSTTRTPFPIGLWFYNGFVNHHGKLNKWIFNRFAATPVLISNVNPDIRQKAEVLYGNLGTRSEGDVYG